MSFNTETWAWFKTAPLPVVLSICMSSFLILGSYAWSIDNEVKAQKTDVAVAAERAKVAAEKAKDAAETTKRVEEKIDKLLEAVIEIKVEKKKEKK